MAERLPLYSLRMSGEYGRAALKGFDKSFLHRLDSRSDADLDKLPMTVKVLLEGMLRAAAKGSVSEADVAALARWPAEWPPWRPGCGTGRRNASGRSTG